jgi:hypothetical protein
MYVRKYRYLRNVNWQPVVKTPKNAPAAPFIRAITL